MMVSKVTVRVLPACELQGDGRVQAAGDVQGAGVLPAGDLQGDVVLDATGNQGCVVHVIGGLEGVGSRLLKLIKS